MEGRILVTIHAPFRHLSNLWIPKMSDFTKSKFASKSRIVRDGVTLGA